MFNLVKSLIVLATVYYLEKQCSGHSNFFEQCLRDQHASFIFIYSFCNLLMMNGFSQSLFSYVVVTSTMLCITQQILRRCGDSVELLDVSNELPELARRPGLNTWKVCIHVTKTMRIFLFLYSALPIECLVS